RQVLINLLSNAVKYNDANGTVTIRVLIPAHDTVRIEIIDTGRGLTDDEIARLFIPFERLGAAAAGIEGTGLGLVLSQQWPRAMGGTLGVSSALGVGTAFWIDLPRIEPAAAVAITHRDDPLAIPRHYETQRTVLYVEDMAPNIRLVEQIL